MDRDDVADRLIRQLRRRLWLARLALAWESLWPVLWPAAGIAGMFLSLALFDALPHLPAWLHAVVLAVFAGAFAAALGRAAMRFRWPSEAQARRRIETDSGLLHRPLAVLGDRISGNPRDPVARGLWQLHRRRVLAAVRDLRVSLPSPGLAARDPLGLRAAVLLLLVVAGAVGYQDIPGRLLRAMAPPLEGAATEAMTAQVWLTPPAYTGLPPVFLEKPAANQPEDRRRIVVPAGTAVMALLQGTDTAGALRLGDRAAAFERLGDGSQKAEAALKAGDSIGVEVGRRTLASWPVEVVADALPSIRFAAPPDGDEAGRLRLTHEAADDYGVVKAWAEIRPVDQPQAEPLVVELPAPPQRAGQRASAAVPHAVVSRHDLTAHTLAGQPVTITPVAADGAEQRGEGEAVNTVLPERIFTHPVAQAIIELRRKVVPGNRELSQVLWGLDHLSAEPEAFGSDIVVFLSLRAARARLYHGRGDERLEQVRDIMWQTALRIEEGDRGIAEKALAEATRALEEALQNGASAEEIDQLLDELQQAMQQYLQALAEEAQRKGLQPMPMDPGTQTVSPDELSDMLEQMREMARLGSRDAAQQMLSELRSMMENLRMGMQGGGQNPQMQQAQQALKELSQVARDQRELMDQSFRQSQQRGGGDPQASRQGAEQQDELRRRLGEVMRSLGESLGDIPQELGGAEQSMRDAAGRLGQNDPGSAAEAQGQALQQMQQGAQAAMEALSQQMQQGGSGFAGMQNGGGKRRDPFGRRLRDPLADDGSVHVPDEAEMHRAREVLDELRRRASQPDRPRVERDYLQRLLKPF